MSEIRANKIQAGISLTPANNFVLDASADDGSVHIKNGAGDIVATINDLGRLILYNDGLTQRALKVGEYGLGSSEFLGSTSLNDLLSPGFAHNNGTHSEMIALGFPSIGIPDAVSVWWDVLTTGVSNRVTQYATEVFGQGGAKGRTFVRVRHDTTWSSWREIYTQNTILGTVSQSGGVPTGAIIEAGSNANGDYTKFADGTLICTKSDFSIVSFNSVSAGLYFPGLRPTWTFPSTFSQIPLVNNSWEFVSGSSVLGASVVTLAIGSCSLTGGATVSGATAYAHAVAIGRWF